MQSEMDVALARCWPGVGRGVTVAGVWAPQVLTWITGSSLSARDRSL